MGGGGSGGIQLPLPWDQPRDEKPARGTSAESIENGKRERLTRLLAEAAECTRCGLRTTCTQVVFGDGNPTTPLMLVGEGPGKQEDIQGQPFVGRAGQLLDRILHAIGLRRKDIYITNVVKCRPPANRTPTPEETKACAIWLDEQIQVIKPAILVCLGAAATRRLVDATASVKTIRGRWIERRGIRIMPTYHPAALLYNPALKRSTWQDFQEVRKALVELGHPKRQEQVE